MKILFAFLFFLLLSLETSYSCFNDDFPLLKREMYNQCTDIIIEAGQIFLESGGDLQRDNQSHGLFC